ncbi:Glucose/arabinose dehydrogenase, beta-propeller fold [Micromonospora rhizosphaerae]|uniref:Glucose/arabinose dehydrogenase, beta-propeller fold n=1 Tax=Micromonospora rhizosphaerae TaxID=568872 RepID=A0A1C6SYU6_9ACTN|nr:DNRLRE domain-containing protein [Micromonospora rhizosphaerae]SCL34731.1 Glucose/arabinose dehydrogenase, beta-propeller fold [Micromonospora rhizosphaerae]
MGKRSSLGWVVRVRLTGFRIVLVVAVIATALVSPFARPAAAATLPAGFAETISISGLTNPTAFQFAPDGRVFVAEKSGIIKVFDTLTDTTPTIFADLRTQVHNFWDRGLLGLALHPSFATRPYVYALYTHDAPIGGTAPRWGTAGATSDPCPNPPGATADGCVVSGRLSRLPVQANGLAGAEQVMIEGWCQQYPSHSVGSLAFGPDGALYVSGGDGASFNFLDYGQDGNPLNPCGDPPVGVGGTQTPPTAEGGRLRSQDLRTPGDPVGLNGTILRVDPETGAALPDNPLFANADANARRIIAYGLRNPFRLGTRPGTNEIWIGDVGDGVWEEIDRVPNPTDARVENFGWPCYEGPGRLTSFDNLNLNICENLYAEAGAAAVPYFTYNHSSKVVPGETCPTGSSSIAGVDFRFYPGGGYPTTYDGALFFADYSRDCIWAMLKGADGLPDPTRIQTFVAGAASPVYLQTGPGGDLFYADFSGGTIRRISYTAGNQTPTAIAKATPTGGAVPLTVSFDATGSTDPDQGDTLSYAWDLDSDGQYDDSNAATPTYTYTEVRNYSVGLKVTDNHGASDTDSLTIAAGNTPPTATIVTPSGSTTWKVGDTISFSGSASDREDGALPASAFSWSVTLQHCPSNCHSHPLQDFPGIVSGSFPAPDHDYPSYLELKLTVADSGGLTDTKTLRLDPQTTTVEMRSNPTGLRLTMGATTMTTPFTRTVIAGSKNTISAPSPQTLGSSNYEFQSWSDNGAQTHDIVAGTTATTYTATYRATSSTLTLSAEADARVQESTPNTNYGASFLRADGGSEPDVESYLRFTVSGVSGTIQTAKLRLYAYSGTVNGPAVYAASNSWSETAVTWATRPARASGAIDDKTSIPGNSWVEYDVKPLITGNGTYSFGLIPQSTDGIDLYSREHTNATLRPQLLITLSVGTTTTTAVPVAADARVAESTPTTNYGAATTLRVDGGSEPDVESYLTFTVSGLPGVVQTAKLRVHTTSSTSSATVNGPAVYGVAAAWTESGITWNNRPPRSTPILDDKGSLTANSWVEYNVTSVVTGNGSYSFNLATTSVDGTDFYSREASTFRPELVIVTAQ